MDNNYMLYNIKYNILLLLILSPLILNPLETLFFIITKMTLK